jgi:hypothetical protein
VERHQRAGLYFSREVEKCISPKYSLKKTMIKKIPANKQTQVF